MNAPKTMSGVYLTGHGGPEVLEWRDDIPVPEPGAGQVLVRVAAAGVNNTDINTRVGWYSSDVTGATDAVDQKVEAGGWGGALHFPRIQGGDLCGIVEQVGPGVAFKPGQRVTCPINLPRTRPGNPQGFIALGSEIDGAFAQYCLVEADDLYDVSASPLSDVEIAAIPCAFGTAENLLTRAGVTAGHKVLITGASGGVGLAAVQLAALRGASVWAVTAGTKAEIVKSQGAENTFDRNDPLPQDMFDVVIDVVGGPAWPSLILSLKPGGHYAVSGAIAGPIVEADLRDIYLRDITIHGCTHQAPEVFARLVELVNTGRIKPLVSRTYPLKDIGVAQADFQSKTLPGKLVLVP
ncbi:alcohol dehydrogenase family protein [Ruegeria sp. HKCCD6157]|uniref:alcohol dehydrogenase family protein n=1 Tax=Ruegeria sp. HKCCD6157 TaxID=2690707 RepID=UPI001492CED5|nr:alcohol dehydrogenase family protein [Ruegeria sp. HKCCD6157]NOE28093.1 zinc-binding dehydrogenase [Ruegeria sp. HKCCD6157]